MIARLWRTRLAPGREADYVAFAVMHSLPMFRALPGCLGVRFLGGGLDRSVLSLWVDADAIAALASHPDYLRVSTRLARSGILASVAPVECREVGEDGIPFALGFPQRDVPAAPGLENRRSA